MDIERGIERGFQFVESLAGGLLDLVFGRGGDGVPGSSAESYVQPEHGQNKTDIHINADNLNLNAQSVNVQQPQHVAEPSHAQENNAPDQGQAQFAERQAQEDAYWQIRAQAEQQYEQQQSLSR